MTERDTSSGRPSGNEEAHVDRRKAEPKGDSALREALREAAQALHDAVAKHRKKCRYFNRNLSALLFGLEAALATRPTKGADQNDELTEEEKMRKPCPFCGKQNLMLYDERVTPRVVFIFCQSCEMHGPEATTVEAATDAWNARVEPPKGDEALLLRDNAEYAQTVAWSVLRRHVGKPGAESIGGEDYHKGCDDCIELSLVHATLGVIRNGLAARPTKGAEQEVVFCVSCGEPARGYADRDERQWWRTYCALSPEFKRKMQDFARTLGHKYASSATHPTKGEKP